jgi:hypothetical protein
MNVSEIYSSTLEYHLGITEKRAQTNLNITLHRCLFEEHCITAMTPDLQGRVSSMDGVSWRETQTPRVSNL